MNRQQNNEREFMAIARSPLVLSLELAALVGIICTFVAIGQFWGRLPETIPIHFGLTGQPQNWGNKPILCLLPTVGTLIYLIFTFSPYFSQLFDNSLPIPEEQAQHLSQIVRELFAWMKVQIIWLFFFIEWQIIQVSLGNSQTIATTFIFTALIFLGGTIGFYYQQADL
ncbi:DUF1648 domain-containing protein [Phormidium sp. CCY1219]|uniref:DUF1648 domain-containing protein n=1 Tax=Phormidium sp. CCY1219 TaxID=2886104 RepID=UPI002D1EA7E6|nr:DUF1648 domain-containing protein [Phormidium sp. CCY1219]MEB3828619.1 DUF1648 domain-containing protein [Phormidium sp. CCY1219]